MGKAVAVLILGGAAFVAFPELRRVQEAVAIPEDATLVLAVLGHAVGGFVLAVLQWATGAGGARAWLGRDRSTVANVLLLGFPLSLPLVAVLVATALLVPHGHVLAVAGWLLCLTPLLIWRPPRGELGPLLGVIAAVFPFAIGFGCWLGLLWHGPTETLSGYPSGDLVTYASRVSLFASHPYPFPNLGYERGAPSYLFFNFLFPSLGAALSSTIALDPFLFIVAAGASFHVVSLACALYLFANARAQADQPRLRCLVLGLSVIVGMQYPFWTVESIPVVYILPIAIAVVYWTGVSRTQTWATLIAPAIACVVPVLSKVVAISVLVPVAFAPIASAFWRIPRFARAMLLVIALFCGAVSVVLLVEMGPLWISKMMGFGPPSYNAMLNGASPGTILLLLMRDVAAVTLAGVCFLFLPRLTAAAIAAGMLLFLAYRFLFYVDFMCATLVVGLLAYESPPRLERFRFLAGVALLPAAPAALLMDPAGVWSGFAWLLFVGGAVWIALSSAGKPEHKSPPPGRGWFSGRWLAPFGALALVLLVLTGVARGDIVPSSRWPRYSQELTPQLRDVWRAVRNRTPPDALIFTDQTGPEPTLLGGWNIYATFGDRQIFVSDLIQTGLPQSDPEEARRVLRENEKVLAGTTSPDELHLRGTYGSYFAVVDRSRTVPERWSRIYQNERYALFRM